MKRERLPLYIHEHTYLNCEGSIPVPFIVNPILFHFSRGGGELGREWYLQGKLKNKHKGFEVWLFAGLPHIIFQSRKNGEAALFSCNKDGITKRYNSPTSKTFCPKSCFRL